MARSIQFTCSSCGNHEAHYRTVAGVKKFTANGWRSLGDVIYCKQCADRIREREGERRLHTREETNEWIYNKIL